ncbi:hypothetical protein GCM10010298_01890 [Streptomyces microflavus]|nr:hypothetical protein GCM10010298_01890 [Streptomyces microflavus]
MPSYGRGGQADGALCGGGQGAAPPQDGQDPEESGGSGEQGGVPGEGGPGPFGEPGVGEGGGAGGGLDPGVG